MTGPVVYLVDACLRCHLKREEKRNRPAKLARSTLARSAGYAASLLDRIYNRIREFGCLRFKIHTDDTRLPILAPGMGKTHKDALCAYAVDDRNSGSQEPPLIWFRATHGRAGENVMTELGDFAGILQADAFTGYNQLYPGGQGPRGCLPCASPAQDL